MFRGFRNCLVAFCAVLLAMQPSYAAKPSFAELLDRAQAQAAAGHLVSPPDDNMTETVAVMVDLLPTATTDQLARFSELFKRGSRAPPVDLHTSSAADTPPPTVPPDSTAPTPMPSAAAPSAMLRPASSITALDVPSEATAPAAPAPIAAAHSTALVQSRHHGSYCSSRHRHSPCH